MWKLIRAAIPVQLLEMEMQQGRCEGSGAQRGAVGEAPGDGAGSPLTLGSASAGPGKTAALQPG